jgi:predicted protein tyrosine phosphatase
LNTPFAITVCGIDELAGHIDTRASHVLSILDPTTPQPEAFGSYGEHERLELRFDDVVDETPDHRAPSRDDVAALLAFGRDLLAEPRPGAHLLVHCHAGISRSTAAMSLILAQALPEHPAAEILAKVHEIREKAWPNIRMMEFGDAMLQRNGTLIAATHALHAVQIVRRPQLVELMEGFGRRREVAVAQAIIAEKA